MGHPESLYAPAVPRSTAHHWLSAHEAATALGLTLRTAYCIIGAGDLTAYKFRRVLRIKRSDLEDYMERSRVKPGDLAHLYPQGATEPDEDQVPFAGVRSALHAGFVRSPSARVVRYFRPTKPPALQAGGRF